jgi:hypothetical protein
MPDGPALETVTHPVPLLAVKAAGTTAVSFVAEKYVVVRAVLAQFTTEAATKLSPFTVSTKSGPPGATEIGERVPINGTGLGGVARATDADMSRNIITNILRDILLALLSILIIRFLFLEFGDSHPHTPAECHGVLHRNLLGRGFRERNCSGISYGPAEKSRTLIARSGPWR